MNNNQNIKATIFDLNGVFLESAPLSEMVEKKFNIDKDIFWLELKKALKIARTAEEKPDDLWEPVIKMLNLSKKEFFDFWFSGEKINLDLVSFVKELKKKGYKIFILSNNFKDRTEFYRKNFPELLNLFDETYFSYETGFIKPDPKSFLNILEKNNLKPEECIYFDDSSDNIEVAKNLGINAKIYEGLEALKKLFNILPQKSTHTL